ncbi:MAG: VCBS repeat-containing protein [Caldilineaceae bacterium]|nr:VCBS repeat-containing protein [Caldilineaceae bacterium]
MNLKPLSVFTAGACAVLVALLVHPTIAHAAPAVQNAPFGPPIELNSDAQGAHFVSGVDLDSDGDIDVVSAARDDGKIIWYRNNGANPVGVEQIEIAVAPGAYVALPVDLNNDGAPDLAVAAVGTVRPSAASASADEDAPADSAAQPEGRVLWLENQLATGQGFIARDILTGIDYPVSLFAADLDNDGDQDLAGASREDAKIIWYENLGGPVPTFVPRVLNDDYAGAVFVHGGDLDGDGDIDLVSAHERVDYILMHENLGGSPPEFGLQIIRTPSPTFDPTLDFAKTVFVTDLDGDGDNDVAFGSEEGDEIGWYANNGAPDPSFELRIITGGIKHVKQVVGADMDLDGDIDLLTTASVEQTVKIFWNDGAPVPSFTPTVLTDKANGARAVAAADITNDGLPDVIAGSRYDNRVILFENESIHRSAYFPPGDRRVLDVRSRMRHLDSADLDRDGDTDIVSVSDTELLWHVNQGGTPPTFETRVLTNELEQGRWVDLADVDGDGLVDAIAASTQDNSIYWFENQGPPAFNFERRRISNNAAGARAALAADIDGDGDMDIYSASHGDNKVAWYENLGGAPPAFAEHVVTTDAIYARSVYAADLDNDGDMDLMSASQEDDLVRWYQNSGAQPPTFTPFVVASADGVQHVHAADVDGDGDMDILYAAEHESSIAWLENLGGPNPGFDHHFVDTNAPGAHAVTAADVDADGDMDLIGAIEFANEFVWYENNGAQPPAFTRHTIYDKALNAHGVNTADVDGDGDLDILGASREDRTAGWFENLGGQYAAGFQSYPSSQVTPGRWQSMAVLNVVHRGRPGDADVRVNRVELTFLDQAGNRLDATTVNQRIAQLGIFREANGDGLFDPAADYPVAVLDQFALDANGVLSIQLPIDPVLGERVPYGAQGTYYVGVVLGGECSDQGAPFNLALVLSGRTAVDNLYSAPLLAEGMRSLGVDTEAGEEEQPTTLLLNEFVADNVAGLEDPDEPGERPDWVEIYNATAADIDLGGFYLTDDLGVPTKYRIPDGVVVPAYGYVVFIADGDYMQGPLHTNFRLDRDGESIGLFDRDANRNRAVDVLTYHKQEPDVSYGRMPNGGDNWRALKRATPGSYNLEADLIADVFLPMISPARGCR